MMEDGKGDIPARMISISTVFSADLLKRRFWFLGVLIAVVKRVLMNVVLPSPDSPVGGVEKNRIK